MRVSSVVRQGLIAWNQCIGSSSHEKAEVLLHLSQASPKRPGAPARPCPYPDTDARLGCDGTEFSGDLTRSPLVVQNSSGPGAWPFSKGTAAGGLPQRGIATQPKVGAPRLPWVWGNRYLYPNGVASRSQAYRSSQSSGCRRRSSAEIHWKSGFPVVFLRMGNHPLIG